MSPASQPVAIVGIGAILPDAPDATAFWRNVCEGHYSISDVDPERWDPDLYYDPDPHAPDKTYSKIGGWVRDWDWDPLAWRLPIPPKVGDAMDDAQKWAVASTRMALLDYGWPERPLDPERTAVILGNAMAGEKHYLTDPAHHDPGARAPARADGVLRLAAGRRSHDDRARAADQHGELAAPDHRGHDARRAGQHASPAGSPTCSTSAARTSPSTPPAPPPWRR